MKNTWLVFSALLVLCCNSTENQKIIFVDTSANYPELDVQMGNIADIRYIKLGGEDEGIHITSTVLTHLYVDERREQLLIWQNLNSVYIAVFDMQGHFIRRIGRKGNGPGEYHQLFKLAYDSDNDIITVYDGDKFIRYRSSGEYLGEEPSSFDMFGGELFKQDDALVFFCPHARFNNPNDYSTLYDNMRTLTTLDCNDLREIPVKNHIFGKSWNIDGASWLNLTPGVCYTKEGHLLTTCLSDTTYLFDKNRNMVPYLLDKRHNKDKGFALCPTIDTDDYLFLVLIPSLKDSYPIGQRFYAIRKADKTVFSCGNGLGFRLSNRNSPAFHLSTQTLTPSYGMSLILLRDIREAERNKENLPKEISVLSDGMTEESNAILMLLHFK